MKWLCMKKISCIYRITCLPTGKFYLGSTVNWQDRYWDHISRLRSKSHTSPRLQNAFSKYGESNFKFEVFEACEEENLRTREQFWISETKCYVPSIGFNICPEVDFGSYGAIKNAKEYIVTFPDGREQTIINLGKFCRKHKLNAGAMSQVAQGNVNQHKNYLCRYSTASSEDWTANKKRGRKSGGGWQGDWLVTLPDGTEQTVTSLTAFCEQNGLSQGNMIGVSLGQRQQHKGYRCRKVKTITCF